MTPPSRDCFRTSARTRWKRLAISIQRPGMVRVNEGGAAIHMKVWELPAEHFCSFVDGIPAPLGIGKVKLADGSWVSGFVCEAIGVEGGTEITALGGWRAWLAR